MSLFKLVSPKTTVCDGNKVPTTVEMWVNPSNIASIEHYEGTNPNSSHAGWKCSLVTLQIGTSKPFYWDSRMPDQLAADIQALDTFGSPATTDWMREFINIQMLRDKAIRYIVSATPADGLFVSDFYVQVGTEFVEIRHIGIDKDGRITLNDKEIEPIVSADVPDSDWVMLARIVQETIEGGTGK